MNGNEMKQIIRLGLMLVAGMIVGRLVLALVPDGVLEFVRAAPTTVYEIILGMGRPGALSLTLGLIAICTTSLVCCYLVEITALLIAHRKARKEESTDLAGRTLNTVQRIAAPLLLGVIGGLLIVSLAFEEHRIGAFASYPWLGPAAVLGVLLAAFIKTSLKKKVLEQVVANNERKD